MSLKTQSYLLSLLVIIVALATTHFFEWGMAGLTAFILAYATKGIRRSPVTPIVVRRRELIQKRRDRHKV
jgi:hypothetical protein